MNNDEPVNAKQSFPNTNMKHLNQKSLLGLLLVFGFILAAGAQTAKACSCSLPNLEQSEKERVTESFKRASAVFVGKVESVTEVSASKKKVRLKVSRVFKGPKTDLVEVMTGKGGGDCGFPFRVDEEYLVFAYGGKNDTTFETNICTRTKLLENAESDLKLLKLMPSS